MKHLTYRNLRHLPLFLCCLLGLGGCDQSSSPPAADISTDISVSLRLRAGAVNETRAIDEMGAPVESRVDLDNLKILVFDKDETLHDVLYDNGIMDTQTSLSNVGPGEYVLITKLDPDKYDSNSEFAIVALANWQTKEGADPRLSTDMKGHSLDKSEIGVLTLSDLKEMTLTLNPLSEETASWMPGEGNLIPMFGSRYTSLRGYDPSIFGESNPMPVPEICLVRALTKIEIVNRDLNNGPVITGIELTQRNRKGWLMQDFRFQGSTDNVTAVTGRGEPEYTTSPLLFRQNGNVYTAYIPEMEFSDITQRRAIRVSIDQNGTAGEKWIYLAPYAADSTPILQGNYSSDWDSIKRNYIYRFTINSLGFEFLIDAMPWVFGGKVHIELE